MQNFTAQDFEEIFDQIIEQKIKDDDVKKFLLDLNDANLPANSFIGAVSSLKKRMKTIKAPENAIDVCGTGGDKLNTLNISTAVCFVVAAAGVPVAKHGNKAISSKSGSADIFSELGVKISDDAAEIEKNLREKNLSFLFAPFFHGALKSVAEIRKSLGVPTIFNFLGPLLNPANTKFQLVGVSRRDVIKKMAACLSAESYIVHGFDGMDEITLSDNSYLFCNGSEQIIDPTKFGLSKVSLDQLRGGDVKYNAQKLVALLRGEKSAYRDIVALNSAFALKLVNRVKGIEEGLDLACKLIDDGSANLILEKCRS
jgi:anthranilate phosphoribosyltransferase